MSSTPWHSARLVRASLLLGAAALVLTIPVGAMHVACDHAGEGAGEPHHCAVCRHYQDGTPLPVVVVVPSAPALVTALVPSPTVTAIVDGLPPARGRSPPAHVSVS